MLSRRGAAPVTTNGSWLPSTGDPTGKSRRAKISTRRVAMGVFFFLFVIIGGYWSGAFSQSAPNYQEEAPPTVTSLSDATKTQSAATENQGPSIEVPDPAFAEVVERARLEEMKREKEAEDKEERERRRRERIEEEEKLAVAEEDRKRKLQDSLDHQAEQQALLRKQREERARLANEDRELQASVPEGMSQVSIPPQPTAVTEVVDSVDAAHVADVQPLGVPPQQEEKSVTQEFNANLSENKEKEADDVPKEETAYLRFIRLANVNGTDPINNARRQAVRDAFHHAWDGYAKYAFGHDEISPTTNTFKDNWGGWGASIVDAIDTMMILGLADEVARAREHVSKLNFNMDREVSFFETTIRFLGGLLGAYELSRDELYLNKARELADRLLPCFDSSPSGVPTSMVNLRTGKAHSYGWIRGQSLLAEIGSNQLEFAYLSYHTKDPKYWEKSRKVFSVLDEMSKPMPGLYPDKMDPSTKEFTSSRVSLGSLADSYFEYLLKLYLLTDKTDKGALKMFREAMSAVSEHMISRVPGLYTDKTMTFLAEMDTGRRMKHHVMEHLACFSGGLYALGGKIELPKPEVRTKEEVDYAKVQESYFQIGSELTETCATLYFETKTGLGPESVTWPWRDLSSQERLDPPPKGEERLPNINKVYRIELTKYMLRPETLESIFVMWRQTHDPKYREWGWKIFQAIEKICRTKSSYTGVKHVHPSDQPIPDNAMESFFFAETLKYLYLLFSDDDIIPLDKYVLNTEAHTLGVLPGGLENL